MSDDGDLGLAVGGSTMPIDPIPLEGEAGSEAETTRFPFTTQAVSTTRAAPPVPVEPAPQPADIVVQVRERSPVGATDLSEDTFSSIAALYHAHLAGEVSRAGLVDILDARVREPRPGTESEIKVLIQQYPNEAVLHNALGQLLAGQSRWPEAQAAFARAAETGEGAR